MKKQETSLMYIQYVGTAAGTAMCKALKDFAKEEFDESIIDKSQLNEVVETLKLHSSKLHDINPRWKEVVITLADNCCGIKGYTPDLFWLRVDGETILTIQNAKSDYAQAFNKGWFNCFRSFADQRAGSLVCHTVLTEAGITREEAFDYMGTEDCVGRVVEVMEEYYCTLLDPEAKED